MWSECPLNLGEVKFFSIQLCSTDYLYLCFSREVIGPYGCYRAQCLRVAVFCMRNVTTTYLHYSYSTSQDNFHKHSVCLLCCTNQIPFQVLSISILTAVSNGRWDISKTLCSRYCNSGVGEAGLRKQKQGAMKSELFSRFLCLFSVLCKWLILCGPALLAVERICSQRTSQSLIIFSWRKALWNWWKMPQKGAKFY